MKKQLLLLCLIGIGLVSCINGKKNMVNPVQEGQLQPLTLGVMSTMDELPFIIAKKQGIYDSLGLDVDFIRYNSANDRDAAFKSEKIDGAVTDYPSVIVLNTHPTALSIVMENNGYFCFIVSKQSGINTPGQLKLKNIAISRNTVVEYATDLFMNKIGIQANEINKPEIGQIPLRLQMLQYSQIDASFLPDPFASIAMNSGHKSLISTQELGISFTCTAFSQKSIQEKHREIELLIEGYNLGVKYIWLHPQKEWEQILVEEIKVPETLTGLIALPPYKAATRASEQDVSNAINWLKAHGRIPDTYQGENLIDTTFVNSK